MVEWALQALWSPAARRIKAARPLCYFIPERQSGLVGFVVRSRSDLANSSCHGPRSFRSPNFGTRPCVRYFTVPPRAHLKCGFLVD